MRAESPVVTGAISITWRYDVGLFAQGPTNYHPIIERRGSHEN